MKYLFFCLFTLLSTVSNPQNRIKEYKAVTDNFELNYNSGNYNAVFMMYSSEMKKAIAADKTIAFLTKLKLDAGEIVSKEITKFNELGVESIHYKVKFQLGYFDMQLSLNDKSEITGYFIKPYAKSTAPIIERNITKLQLPFNEEWTIVWGGDTKELNYHVENNAQKNAFDMVITNTNGLSYKTDGLTNEDYYVFGKELIAPCNAEVVLVVDGVKDNIPGQLNPTFVTGNTVILKTENGEYIYIAHFKQHSIVVKQGQYVKQGEPLGQCGNSGNSSEPHLHFHIQNTEAMTGATGIKCYFDTILVNGSKKTDYSPIKNEQVMNPN